MWVFVKALAIRHRQQIYSNEFVHQEWKNFSKLIFFSTPDAQTHSNKFVDGALWLMPLYEHPHLFAICALKIVDIFKKIDVRGKIEVHLVSAQEANLLVKQRQWTTWNGRCANY